MKSIYILAAFALSFSLAVAAEGDKKPKGDKPKHDPEKVFSKKDTNGDKKLSKEEFTKNAKDSAKAEKRFGILDKDKDGFVTLEELKAQGPKKEKKSI